MREQDNLVNESVKLDRSSPMVHSQRPVLFGLTTRDARPWGGVLPRPAAGVRQLCRRVPAPSEARGQQPPQFARQLSDFGISRKIATPLTAATNPRMAPAWYRPKQISPMQNSME